MLVSMMSQSAMIQSSYNLPTPTIINRLGDVCWCGDPTGEVQWHSQAGGDTLGHMPLQSEAVLHHLEARLKIIGAKYTVVDHESSAKNG